jgi:murein DD-endopeptidase MepM/ murein hydrolase activator NlpD
MVDSLRERARTVVSTLLPERHIYVRSKGHVQFFALSSFAQAILVGAACLVLGWVAFASVSTIFSDSFLAAREDNFRQIQASYEARIARLQMSYDRVNSAFSAAEDRFTTLTDQLEAKHRALATLIGRRTQLRASLGMSESRNSATESAVPQPRSGSGLPRAIGGAPTLTIPDSISALESYTPPGTVLTDALPGAGPEDFILPETRVGPVETIPSARTHSRRPGDPRAFLGGTVETFAALFRRSARREQGNHPSERAIAALVARLDHLYPEQRDLLVLAEDEITADAKRFSDALRTAGVDPKRISARVARSRPGVGGELLPASFVAGDREFGDRAVRAAVSLEELTNLATALNSVPLEAPVSGVEYEQTSGFGNRKDPFTKTLAFHAGVDFSGPHGSPVQVTAPGVVTYVGRRGAYGLTVEVDHGYGMKTRYGHLSKMLVKVGSKLERGAIVGTLGSTGRSTGPHVHYEVWYDDVVRNPSKFMRAGTNVLQTN